MATIKIVDSIMGSGKTSAAINLMNSDTNHNYIFITPYLTEVQRVKQSCSSRRFYEPKFQSIKGELQTKFDSLHHLLMDEKNIASTHALFKRSNEETRELIRSGNYILILDEVMDVVEQLEIKKSDMQMLFDYNLLYVENGFVIWNEDNPKANEYDGVFNELKQMSLNRNLIYYKETILIWTFPADIFHSFKEVYILTYLFDGQIQKYYYDLNSINYEKYVATQIDGIHTFVKNEGFSEKQFKNELKNKINIYSGNLNDIGNDDYSLSKNWFKNKKEIIQKLKKNTENYLRNKMKAKSEEIMWTTFKDQQSKMKGGGYSKSFVACTSRATNEYKDRKYLAYTINRFVNPVIYGFFNDKQVAINQDLWALSEMIQWIWRSAIREGNEIHIYIPSKRMRNLLIEWLNN